MMAVVFFTLIAYSYKNHFSNRFARGCFVSFCILAIAFVSISRIYLGVHYTTDVIAGLLIGSIISAISTLMYEKHHASGSTH
jgi:undecaprenyl-diphosphatase